jgi:hypothetical protein
VLGTLIEGSEPCVLLLLHGKMLFWPASAKGNPLGGLYIHNRGSSRTLIEGSEPCALLLLHGKMASAEGNPLVYPPYTNVT